MHCILHMHRLCLDCMEEDQLPHVLFCSRTWARRPRRSTIFALAETVLLDAFTKDKKPIEDEIKHSSYFKP